MPTISGSEAEALLEEEVSLPEKVFLKEESNRQSITLPSGYKTSVSDEYAAMQQLYSVTDKVAEPYAETGNGYLVEYLEGRPLQPEEVSEPMEVAAQLSELGSELIGETVPHGDIRRSNVYVNDGNVKLIDAAGIVEGVPSRGPGKLRERAVSWDVTDLNSLIEEVADANSFGLEPYRIEQPAVEF